MGRKRRKQVVGSQLSAIGCRLAIVPIPATGFTLLEMLVALALVSTIVTMVYGSYAATSRSLDLYGSRMACYERTCLVLRLMARQIRCAYMPSSSTGSTPSSPRNAAPPARPTAFQADSRDAGGMILSFLTTGGLGTTPDKPASLSRVLYRYDPSNGTLSIRCEPYVRGADARQGSERWQPILSGITHVDLQFYDGRGWQPRWNGGDGRMPPQAVKIAFTVVDEHDRSHEFRTTVPIGCRNAPQKQQSTGPAGRL